MFLIAYLIIQHNTSTFIVHFLFSTILEEKKGYIKKKINNEYSCNFKTKQKNKSLNAYIIQKKENLEKSSIIAIFFYGTHIIPLEKKLSHRWIPGGARGCQIPGGSWNPLWSSGGSDVPWNPLKSATCAVYPSRRVWKESIPINAISSIIPGLNPPVISYILNRQTFSLFREYRDGCRSKSLRQLNLWI